MCLTKRSRNRRFTNSVSQIPYLKSVKDNKYDFQSVYFDTFSITASVEEGFSVSGNATPNELRAAIKFISRNLQRLDQITYEKSLNEDKNND